MTYSTLHLLSVVCGSPARQRCQTVGGQCYGTGCQKDGQTHDADGEVCTVSWYYGVCVCVCVRACVRTCVCVCVHVDV